MALNLPPAWGVEPVPDEHRTLGGFDLFVLWSGLAFGLLVLTTGGFLSSMDGPTALAAILVGSAAGCVPLALVSAASARCPLPTMALLRGAFGVRGSLLPTGLNVFQLVGWTVLEIYIMALLTSQLVGGGKAVLLGLVALFGAVVILMTVGGPRAVIKTWMEKFAIWVAYGGALYLLVAAALQPGAGERWGERGPDAMGFALAVDLVLVLPLSWMPLAADYGRFARRPRASWGTFAGYFLLNVVAFTLGFLLFKTTGGADIGAALLALPAGALVLALLVTYETDEAWADLYSSVLSLQNLRPRARQHLLAVVVGGLCAAAAVAVDSLGLFVTYELFIIAIGSLFIPLFGVLLVDLYVLKRPYEPRAVLDGSPPHTRGLRWPAFAAWGAGALLYLLTTTLPILAPVALLSSWAGVLGSSLPSFAVSAGLYWALARKERTP